MRISTQCLESAMELKIHEIGRHEQAEKVNHRASPQASAWVVGSCAVHWSCPASTSHWVQTAQTEEAGHQGHPGVIFRVGWKWGRQSAHSQQPEERFTTIGEFFHVLSTSQASHASGVCPASRKLLPQITAKLT